VNESVLLRLPYTVDGTHANTTLSSTQKALNTDTLTKVNL